MSIHELRNHSRRRSIARAVQAAVGYTVVAAVTYIAVVAVQHSPAAPAASSVSASEVPRMNRKPLAETAEMHAAGQTAKAAAPVAAVPGRDFDYFPDHYVNQATRSEEQPPTF